MSYGTTGYRPKRYYDIQESRQAAFPTDRIAFRQSSTAVMEDVACMSAYADGKITFEMLRGKVAYNNYLDRFFPDGLVPENVMHNELRIMGYEQ